VKRLTFLGGDSVCKGKVEAHGKGERGDGWPSITQNGVDGKQSRGETKQEFGGCWGSYTGNRCVGDRGGSGKGDA